ncbi:PKD domain-containing protein [Flavilitoribacter nigricans]|uniref:PKD domain-containing protein n=1 Tax=Flavilitoribacter nigricans (strain ATCC 23147 / DSM 23189 / NBRC 102662 / NCIMB 1420 / SS-2) TaxID=1122177 RepID=A0A2D0NG58_FLAN2|nr:PKD domain-containing protein [Flavilitoribacter nigricans]PHN07481.1 hypothetical protein CRP01_05105 [Flavilitoribacter nigricans DSM 23189 = NBRC 102662]
MKTILIPKIVLLLLCLGVTSPGLLAQFRISGKVAFGEALEPVPDYDVTVYLPVHDQVYTVFTDSKGDYEATFDWTSAEILEARVDVLDLCTGEIHSIRLPNADSSYVANFQLCQGIDPPPPPPGCQAHFTYEQLSVNPPAAVFLDLSYHADPEVEYLWEFGDGTASSEPAPTHEFPATGVYEVLLTIKSGDCSSRVVNNVILRDSLDCVCPAVYNPVCVTLDNGSVITFANACEASCAGFQEGDWSSCEPNECGCPEFYDPVCTISPAGDSLTFSNLCFAECAGYAPDQVFPCNPINECDCAPIDAPVCVVNDAGEILRFANACLARCAGYPESTIVDCNINCICPNDYDPVCVAVAGDTLLFSNPCLAECAGYTQDQMFFCDPPDDCICPQVYDPVCVIGAVGDSLRFANACLAECAGFGPDEYYSCEPGPCVCPEYYDPVCIVVNGDTLTYPNICFAECDGYSWNDVFSCNPDGGCDCPDTYEPVCAVGPDGAIITFQNACIANCRGYEAEDFIDCNANCTCPAVYDPVCVYTASGEQIQFSNRCEAECAGYFGDQIVRCEPEECVCPEYYDPVCVVVNGVTRTFDNECFARCAGFTDADFFRCEPGPCNCPEVYSPVCIVTDFGPAYWFINACEAECAGFGPDQYESCGPEECECPDDLYDPICAISAQGDTLTFGNICRALCAGFTDEDLFRCDGGNGCGCDAAVYDPVCVYTPGGTVLRFGNACEARCAGYDESVWVKCEDSYCQARFQTEHPNTGELGVQFYNRSYPADSLGIVWIWDFGDGTTSNLAHPFHEYAKEGVYTVTLTMISDNCTSSHREQIVVGLDEPIEDCKAMFHFEQNPDDPYFFLFHDRSLGDIVSWSWYFGDGTTSNEPTPEHRYEQAGIYIVSLSVTASDGCTSLVSMLVATDDDIVYNPDCYASFLPVIIPDSNRVFFLNFSSQDVVETHWDFGDGTTSSQLMPIHVYDGNGSYTVTLTVVTANGCTNSYTATINLAGASFTASPAYAFRTTTDVEEPGTPALSVKVFPNPVTTELWLDLKEHPAGPLQWRILNLSGQVVDQGREELSGGPGRFSIRTADLPAGVYALQLISEAGAVTQKFVKGGGR